MKIFLSGRTRFVNAEETAGRDFMATGFCTKHEKREKLHNTRDDLGSKVQQQFMSTIQLNSPQRNKSYFAFAHFTLIRFIYEMCSYKDDLCLCCAKVLSLFASEKQDLLNVP